VGCWCLATAALQIRREVQLRVNEEGKAQVMKRIVGKSVCAALAAFAIMGVVGVAEADFLVIFHNGHEFEVEAYEVVGDKIVYTRFTGKVTIPKALVAEIINLDTGKKRVFERVPPGSPNGSRR
jgi:hypothetical protein